MNEQEKQQMKALLESMRNETLDTIKKLKDIDSPEFIFEEDGDMPGVPYHLADMGTDTMDQERHYLMLQKEYEFLYDVDQALKKLRDNKYGFCEVCNQPIHFERLQAIPFTCHCIACKSTVERNNAFQKNSRFKNIKPYMINEIEEEFESSDW